MGIDFKMPGTVQIVQIVDGQGSSANKKLQMMAY
jgi:hypothetical protein